MLPQLPASHLVRNSRTWITQGASVSQAGSLHLFRRPFHHLPHTYVAHLIILGLDGIGLGLRLVDVDVGVDVRKIRFIISMVLYMHVSGLGRYRVGFAMH